MKNHNRREKLHVVVHLADCALAVRFKNQVLISGYKAIEGNDCCNNDTRLGYRNHKSMVVAFRIHMLFF